MSLFKQFLKTPPLPVSQDSRLCAPPDSAHQLSPGGRCPCCGPQALGGWGGGAVPVGLSHQDAELGVLRWPLGAAIHTAGTGRHQVGSPPHYPGSSHLSHRREVDSAQQARGLSSDPSLTTDDLTSTPCPTLPQPHPTPALERGWNNSPTSQDTEDRAWHSDRHSCQDSGTSYTSAATMTTLAVFHTRLLKTYRK